MREGTHQTAIRLPKELHKSAKMKALESDVTLSEAMRRLLAGWVSGKIELPEEKPPEED